MGVHDKPKQRQISIDLIQGVNLGVLKNILVFIDFMVTWILWTSGANQKLKEQYTGEKIVGFFILEITRIKCNKISTFLNILLKVFCHVHLWVYSLISAKILSHKLEQFQIFWVLNIDISILKCVTLHAVNDCVSTYVIRCDRIL